MSTYRKKRSECLTTEGDNRAQALNLAASRVLSQQITQYEKEEKHLQREMLNLRKTREIIDAGIKLMVPFRARSNSEPQQGLANELRHNSSLSSHLNQRLSPIATKSPIPPRKAATPEDPVYWYKNTTDGEACFQGDEVGETSTKENKSCFPSLADKPRCQRTYSDERLMYKLSEKDFKTNTVEEACNKQGFIEKDPLEKEIAQESNSRRENDPKEIPLTDDVTLISDENGRRRTTVRSQGDIELLRPQGFGNGDLAGSSLNPLHCISTLSLSPRPRRNSLITKQPSQTNIDLMHSMKLTGKFKSVGHTAVGLAVLNQLHVKTRKGENLEEITSEAALRSPVPSPWRRGSLGQANLAPFCPDTGSPAVTRKQNLFVSQEERLRPKGLRQQSTVRKKMAAVHFTTIPFEPN